MAQGVDDAASMFGPITRTAKLGVGDRNEVMQHDHPLDTLGLKTCQDFRRVQAGVADVEIKPGHRGTGDALGPEILFPGAGLLAGFYPRLGWRADDGRRQGIRGQRGEQPCFGLCGTAVGLVTGPAAAQLDEAVSEPQAVDQGQLIMS